MHGQPKHGLGFAHLSYANPDAPKGGTLKQAVAGTFDTLNSFALKGKAERSLYLTHDRLMARAWDEPFTLYPLIAESVEVPEDRSSLTIHLNPAARFHDGSPVTAEDILFSFETLRDHGRPNMRRIYKLIEKTEIKNSKTIHFSFSDGYDRETVMILSMMPVLSKKWWKGREFDTTLLERPLTSGPYRILSFEPGRQIVYERVSDYWASDLPVNKGHYNIDRLVFDYYRDDGVAFEAFKTGDIHLRREYEANRRATRYDFSAAQERKIIAKSLPHGRTERIRGFIFNTRKSPFDDIRVREALSLALDDRWIGKNLFHDQFKRTYSYFPNSDLAATGPPSEKELVLLEPFQRQIPPDVFQTIDLPASSEDRQAHRLNLRKADALLKESGWEIKDGVRVKNDQALSFEIALGKPRDEKLALSLIQGLKRLGVQARVRVLDSAAFLDRLSTYDYDMVLHHWQNSLSPGTEQMLYWSCSAAEQQGRWNYAGICNPAVDKLAASIADTRTYSDLITHTRALDRVLRAGHYIIPLFHAGSDFIAHHDFVRHPEKTPLYGPVLETWWTESP